MPHVASYMRGIYLRPILGHTPRKLPLRASPQSNLSLHRISSPIIISHSLKKSKSFLKIFMTIIYEYSRFDLCILHNFGHILPFFGPFSHFWRAKLQFLLAQKRSRRSLFVHIDKNSEFVWKILRFVTISSHL